MIGLIEWIGWIGLGRGEDRVVRLAGTLPPKKGGGHTRRQTSYSIIILDKPSKSLKIYDIKANIHLYALIPWGRKIYVQVHRNHHSWIYTLQLQFTIILYSNFQGIISLALQDKVIWGCYCILTKYIIIETSVSDPLNVNADPDPRIRFRE